MERTSDNFVFWWKFPLELVEDAPYDPDAEAKLKEETSCFWERWENLYKPSRSQRGIPMLVVVRC